MSTDKPIRNSSYELIRLLAQFFIVFYHLFRFFIYPVTDEPLHRAIWLPLHVGVILFVLISGFFGIKSSIKGFVRLIGMMFVLYVPLDVVNILCFNKLNGGNFNNIISYIFLISATPFWFMRTYVFLYLLAPLLNHFLKSANLPKRIYLIIVLGFISHWVGTVGLDPSLMDGKNVITFMFLYVIGNTLAQYNKLYFQKIPSYYYGIAFLLLNILLVVLYSNWHGRIADILFNRIFFSYCSFGLLLSSILFFLWIGNMHIQSRFINYIAKASLTIYMIHGSNLIFFGFLSGIVNNILSTKPSEIILFIEIFVLSLCIVSLCIIIDIVLRPVWRELDRLGGRFTTLYLHFRTCLFKDTTIS